MNKKFLHLPVPIIVAILIVCLALPAVALGADMAIPPADAQWERLNIKIGPAPPDMKGEEWLHAIGSVSAWQDGVNIYIRYHTYDGWVLCSTNLWVGKNIEDYPQTRKGNPIPGLFPYKDEFRRPVSTHVYTIPMAGLLDNPPTEPIAVLAHATVKRVPDWPGWQSSTDCHWPCCITAWGDCTPLPNAPNSDLPPKRWAKFFWFPESILR